MFASATLLRKEVYSTCLKRANLLLYSFYHLDVYEYLTHVTILMQTAIR